MAARSAATACHALRRSLGDRLRSCYRRLLPCDYSTSAASLAVPAALLCAAAAFPRAAAFFLPLVASTSLCCAAACLFAAAERGAAAKEEVVVRAGGEAALLQVIGDANASAYRRGGVQVGCLLRRPARRGVDEDGEEVVFAGTLAPCAAGGGHAGAMEEELAAMRADVLAEGVWNSYFFGGWSRWHDAYAA